MRAYSGASAGNGLSPHTPLYTYAGCAGWITNLNLIQDKQRMQRGLPRTATHLGRLAKVEFRGTAHTHIFGGNIWTRDQRPDSTLLSPTDDDNDCHVSLCLPLLNSAMFIREISIKRLNSLLA